VVAGPNRRLRPGGRLWLGLVFSLACLVLALYDIDLSEAIATLRGTDRAWLAASLGLVALMVVAKGLRWRLILQPAVATAGGEAAPLGLGRLTSIWIAGASLNLALPAPRSGDLARAYLGEAYLMKGDVASAERQLAEIERRCGTPCEAHAHLAAHIAVYKAGAAKRG